MIGSVFGGRYILNGFLADGPIFALYSAKDKLVGCDLSLRLIKPPFDKEEAFRSAMAQTVQKVSQVQSPSVEKLIELQEEDGEAYIVGELTRAPSLADRIRKLAPFTSSVAVAAGIGIARGLDAFHKAGIVHGDVSGENVAMLADGETRLQMGGIWEAYSASPTAGGVVLPSLAPYMAPEVSSGGMPSVASDLYSVGVLLFELLTGRKPHHGDTAVATAMRHATEATPRVRSINSTVPTVLDEIVYKAMSKDPHSRYINASELLFDLRQVQDALRFGRTLSWPIRAQTFAPSTPTPQPVAPRMSAIRDRPAPQESTARSKWDDRDVPVWMLVLLAGAIGVVGALVAIYVFTNFTRPKMVSVPNVSGQYVSEARSTLQSLHLTLKVGDSIASDLDVDRIVDSDPAPKSKVKENSTITVNLSRGKSEIPVPKLIGITPDTASESLQSVHLVLEKPYDEIDDPNVPKGKICRQDPAANTKVARLSKVHVTVSNHEASSPKPPDATDDTPQQTEDVPEDSNLYPIDFDVENTTEPVHVRIDVVDKTGTKTVYEEDKSPGEHILQEFQAEGKRPKFRIYYDDRLVKEIKLRAPRKHP